MIRNFLTICCTLAVLLPSGLQAQKRNKPTGNDDYVFKVDKKDLDVQSLFIEAVSEKMLGRIEEAVGLFQAVIKLDPANHAAYYELARIAYESNDLVQAEDYASRAVALNPKNEWYHIYLAEARAHQGNYTGAAEAYLAIVNEMPEKWEYLQDVGYMYAQAEKYAEAIRIYDLLEKQEGISEQLTLQKQSLYLKLGKIEKAADEIRKGIAEFPERDNLYILLGEIYEANGYHDKALESYAMLLAREPGNPQALLATAEIQRKSGKEEEYRKTVKQVFGNRDLQIDTKIFMFIPYIELLASDSTKGPEVLEMAELIRATHPDDAKAQTAYADVLLNMGRIDQAIDAYRKATGFDETPINVWIQLFDLLMQKERYDELMQAAGEAVGKYPNDVVPRFYMGVTCLQVDNLDCAIEQFSAGLALEDVNPELRARMWSSLGEVFNEKKLYARSDSCYDEALVINPNDPYTLNNYAYFLSLREERLDKAEKMARRANLLMEGNASFLDTYAWIMYKKGDYKTAREWMEKALEAMRVQGGVQPVLLEHYGDVLYRLGEAEAALDFWNQALEAGGDSEELSEKIRNKSLLE